MSEEKIFKGCKHPKLIDQYIQGHKDGVLEDAKDKIAGIDENEFTTPTDVKRRAVFLIKELQAQ